MSFFVIVICFLEYLSVDEIEQERFCLKNFFFLTLDDYSLPKIVFQLSEAKASVTVILHIPIDIYRI